MRLWFTTALAVLAGACSQPVSVTLQISDPEGLAVEASTLRVGVQVVETGYDESEEKALGRPAFPTVRSIVWGSGEGEAVVWVEALDGERVLARARVQLRFERGSDRQIPVELGAPCEPPESHGLSCEIESGERAFCIEQTCQPSRCGDGMVDILASPAEECDDGNTVDTDSCLNTCRLARCGDGIVRSDLTAGEPGSERCDDGNERHDDACTNDCRTATCGDRITRTDLSENDPDFESCDDGNSNDLDACTSACQVPRWSERIVSGPSSDDDRDSRRSSAMDLEVGMTRGWSANLAYDVQFNRVVEIQSDSSILTLLGGGGECRLQDCVEGTEATSVSLSGIEVTGIVRDHQGLLFVSTDADEQHAVAVVDAGGKLSFLANSLFQDAVALGKEQDSDPIDSIEVRSADETGVYFLGDGAIFRVQTAGLEPTAEFVPEWIAASPDDLQCTDASSPTRDDDNSIGPSYDPRDAVFCTISDLFAAEGFLYVADDTGIFEMDLNLPQEDRRLLRIVGHKAGADPMDIENCNNTAPPLTVNCDFKGISAFTVSSDNRAYFADARGIYVMNSLRRDDFDIERLASISSSANSLAGEGLVPVGPFAPVSSLRLEWRADGSALQFASSGTVSAIRTFGLDANGQGIGQTRTIAGAIHPGDGALSESELFEPRDVVCLAELPADVLEAQSQQAGCVVLDADRGRLRVIDSSSNQLRSVLGFPGGIEDFGPAWAFGERTGESALAATERSLYVFGSSDDVLRIDLDDPDWITSRRTLPDSHQISGAAVEPGSGDLYLASESSHQVLRFDGSRFETVVNSGATAGSSTSDSEFTKAADVMLDQPGDVAVGGAFLYIADTQNGRVLKVESDDGAFTSESQVSVVFQPSSFNPAALAADTHGNLLVAGGPYAVVLGSNSNREIDAAAYVHTVLDSDSDPRFETCWVGAAVGQVAGTFVLVDGCSNQVVEIAAE